MVLLSGAMATTLGDILREYREQAGLTQEQAAHRSGLERTHISMIERSVYMPTVKTFFAYCRAVDAEPADIARRIDEELGDPTEWPETNPPEKSS